MKTSHSRISHLAMALVFLLAQWLPMVANAQMSDMAQPESVVEETISHSAHHGMHHHAMNHHSMHKMMAHDCHHDMAANSAEMPCHHGMADEACSHSQDYCAQCADECTCPMTLSMSAQPLGMMASSDLVISESAQQTISADSSSWHSALLDSEKRPPRITLS